MTLVPPRSCEPEILDRPGNPPEALGAVLAEIRMVNRFLGGTRAILKPLRRLVEEEGLREFTALDAGTGSADIPRAIVRFARATSRRARVIALDVDPGVARIAALETRGWPEILAVRADAFRLPVPPSGVDFVLASMFLHHFREDGVARLLRGFHAAARRAVLVNDLARHRIPWLFIRAAGAAMRRSRMFRNDAPLSVLRGFTAEELRAAARAAGIEAEVRRRFPYRLVLVARKG